MSAILEQAIEEIVTPIIRRILRQEIGTLRDDAAPGLVTVKAYAAARSIAPSTVRAAIKDGRLPAQRIGRALRVPANAEIGRPERVAPDGESHETWSTRILRRGSR